ncbi:MAG: PP2C family protein-serine/threonine phosphatase [Phycisphaeraceae bacterium]|nr:PP2C family protein-serine/threonine phosphatase [Phycisphaeraceae bacterium]
MWDTDSTASLLRGISNTTDPRDLLRHLLAHVRGSFNVQRAIVLSREGLAYPRFRVVFSAEGNDNGAITVADGSDSPAAGGLLADLLYTGQFRRVTPLVVSDMEPSRSLLKDCRSLIAFPLFERGVATGMVVLLGPSVSNCSDQELCGLAVMASLLQRADLADRLAKQIEVTCRALSNELAAAANVQRWLLPRPGPSIDNIDVAASYRTAQHCGGDYYDAGQLPDGRFGVLIADVSGHGAAAAVLMAILRTIVHDEVDRSHVYGAAALLDHADDRLCALGLPSRGAFVTAFSGSLDIGRGTFRYSCAGHPPPRLVRARAGGDPAIMPLDGASTQPLGVLEERPPRQEELTQLEPGDVLVFYSDGVTEARAPSGEFFGVARLDRALLQLPEHPTPRMAVDAISEALHTFAGVGAPTDDQTLLAVRWRS